MKVTSWFTTLTPHNFLKIDSRVRGGLFQVSDNTRPWDWLLITSDAFTPAPVAQSNDSRSGEISETESALMRSRC